MKLKIAIFAFLRKIVVFQLLQKKGNFPQIFLFVFSYFLFFSRI